MRLQKGSDNIVLNRQWVDADGKPKSLTGFTPKLHMANRATGVDTSLDGAIIDSPTGKYQVVIIGSLLSAVAEYECRWEFVAVGQTIPGDHFEIIVEDTAATGSLYCQVQDVADLLGIAIEDNTKPNYDTIEKLILEKMADIERKTKHAWREVKSDEELHDLEGDWELGWGFQIGLHHSKIKQFDDSKGDRFDYWNGANWQPLLIGTSLPDGIVVHYERGLVATKTYSYFWGYTKRFRIQYRYGETVVPYDIRMTCARMVAIEIARSSVIWNVLPIGGDREPITSLIADWQKQIDDKISDYDYPVAIY